VVKGRETDSEGNDKEKDDGGGGFIVSEVSRQCSSRAVPVGCLATG